MAAASLHIGSRVLSAPSTSAPRPAAPPAMPPWPGARAPPRGGGAAAAAAPQPPGPGGQAYRFKYLYTPGRGGPSPLGLPQTERQRGDPPPGHVQRVGDAEPQLPSDLWPAPAAGAAAVPNPHAQRFRIKQVHGCLPLPHARPPARAAAPPRRTARARADRPPPRPHPAPRAPSPRPRQAPVPVPVSFPGSDYWQVDILHDYSKEWPRLAKLPDGKWHLRRGFLGPFADPRLVPFFFYRGLEQVGINAFGTAGRGPRRRGAAASGGGGGRSGAGGQPKRRESCAAPARARLTAPPAPRRQVRYTLGDRALQLIYAAVYTGEARPAGLPPPRDAARPTLRHGPGRARPPLPLTLCRTSPPAPPRVKPPAAHAAVFSLLWASDASLAVAAGLNWARGRLSLAKWGLLFALALSDRMWLYWVFQAGKLIDRGLARLAPPVRRFFWCGPRRAAGCGGALRCWVASQPALAGRCAPRHTGPHLTPPPLPPSQGQPLCLGRVPPSVADPLVPHPLPALHPGLPRHLRVPHRVGPLELAPNARLWAGGVTHSCRRLCCPGSCSRGWGRGGGGGGVAACLHAGRGPEEGGSAGGAPHAWVRRGGAGGAGLGCNCKPAVCAVAGVGGREGAAGEARGGRESCVHLQGAGRRAAAQPRRGRAGASLRAERAVAGVAEARHDVALLVELRVDDGGVHAQAWGWGGGWGGGEGESMTG
jgi:hypothetical protein